jgi:hypothetical protein
MCARRWRRSAEEGCSADAKRATHLVHWLAILRLLESRQYPLFRDLRPLHRPGHSPFVKQEERVVRRKSRCDGRMRFGKDYNNRNVWKEDKLAKVEIVVRCGCLATFQKVFPNRECGSSIPGWSASHSHVWPSFPGDAGMDRKSRLFARSTSSPGSQIGNRRAPIGESLRPLPRIFRFAETAGRDRVRSRLPPAPLSKSRLSLVLRRPEAANPNAVARGRGRHLIADGHRDTNAKSLSGNIKRDYRVFGA